MNYERYFKIFEKQFSSSRIHVLLYEELLRDAQSYYQRWSDLLAIPLQDVLSHMANHVERRRNTGRRMVYDRWVSRLSLIPGFTASQAALLHFVPFVHKWLDDGPPAKISLPTTWEQRVSDYYRCSNANLAKITGLDLARYGYPL